MILDTQFSQQQFDPGVNQFRLPNDQPPGNRFDVDIVASTPALRLHQLPDDFHEFRFGDDCLRAERPSVTRNVWQ
jgi:hypothetical protein